MNDEPPLIGMCFCVGLSTLAASGYWLTALLIVAALAVLAGIAVRDKVRANIRSHGREWRVERATEWLFGPALPSTCSRVGHQIEPNGECYWCQDVHTVVAERRISPRAGRATFVLPGGEKITRQDPRIVALKVDNARQHTWRITLDESRTVGNWLDDGTAHL